MKTQNPETNAKLEPYYTRDDWIIMKGQKLADPAYDSEYFFVWTGESLLEPSFIEAAHKINFEQQTKKLDLIVGCVVIFHSEPSPGFVVRTRATWDFENPTQAGSALEKVLWEVNRLARL
jgi:hypothetical protein